VTRLYPPEFAEVVVVGVGGTTARRRNEAVTDDPQSPDYRGRDVRICFCRPDLTEPELAGACEELFQRLCFHRREES
jgi:hypothetical protein